MLPPASQRPVYRGNRAGMYQYGAYAAAIRAATGLPVFSIYNFILCFSQLVPAGISAIRGGVKVVLSALRGLAATHDWRCPSGF